jgi:hypothetical protein
MKLFNCLSSRLKMDENALVDGTVMVNFGWKFSIVPNAIIDLSICISEANINGNILLPTFCLMQYIYQHLARSKSPTVRDDHMTDTKNCQIFMSNIYLKCTLEFLDCLSSPSSSQPILADPSLTPFSFYVSLLTPTFRISRLI